MTLKHPPGPPMDLANMRRQGVHHLIAHCLNDSCRHQALIDVSKYPGDTPVPWFAGKVVCNKCGPRGNRHRRATELGGSAGLNRRLVRPAGNAERRGVMARWHVDYLGKKGSHLGHCRSDVLADTAPKPQFD